MSATARGRVARAVARLTGRVQLERLAALEEKVAKFGRAHRDALRAQEERLDRIDAMLSSKAGGDALRDLDRRVERVQTSLIQQDRALSEALARAGRLDEQGVDDRRFARRIESFLRHDRPIVVGPWTGEVGFELLYWIPFVRWVAATYDIPRERLLVVSRGGAQPWYDGLAGRYDDLFSHVTPDAFRAATEQSKKQRLVGEFDARMLERVVQAHALQRPAVLHPGMMYRLFMPFWKELATSARVDAYSRHVRLCRPVHDVTSELPREYIAARFYFSDCFPDTAANREFVSAALETLGRQLPVVLLSTPFAVDDHRDAAAPDRAISVARHMTPEQNLAVQTAVIGGARAFVGTYGGYSYLAPFVGVPSLAFYSDRTFKAHHLHLAQRVFDRLGGPSVVALDVGSLPLLRLALAGVPLAAS